MKESDESVPADPLIIRLHSRDRHRIELLAILPSQQQNLNPDTTEMRRRVEAHHPLPQPEFSEDSGTATIRWRAKKLLKRSKGSYQLRETDALLRLQLENRLWSLVAAPGWLCLGGAAVYTWKMLDQQEPAGLFAVIILAAFALLFFNQRDKAQGKAVEELRRQMLALSGENPDKR